MQPHYKEHPAISLPSSRLPGEPIGSKTCSPITIRGEKSFKLQELAMLPFTPIVRSIQHWWLQRAEKHFLICADVEQQRAREAQLNVAYYQKRAALARSART